MSYKSKKWKAMYIYPWRAKKVIRKSLGYWSRIKQDHPKYKTQTTVFFPNPLPPKSLRAVILIPCQGCKVDYTTRDVSVRATDVQSEFGII